MATQKTEIASWFDRGITNPQKPTHMIVVCDIYDWENYPVYVNANEEVREKCKYYDSSNMQKVMEVYNLKLDKQKQLNTTKNFNY